MRYFLSCLFILTGIAMSSTSIAASPAEEAGINSSWAAYKKAAAEKNGPAVADLFDQHTWDYYDQMRQLALRGDEAKVRGLLLPDKLIVLTFRGRVPIDILKTAKAPALIAYLVQNGMIGNAANYESLPLADIQSDGKKAAVRLAKDGKLSPFQIWFAFERNAWRVNLKSMLYLADVLFANMAQKSGKSEDEFLIERLSQVWKREVPPTIWQPLENPT